jgi:hypothetical protein
MAGRRRTAAERAALIDEWRESGLSLPAFSRRRGVVLSTLRGWVYKPGRGPAPAAHRTGPAAGGEPATFLPVRVTDPPPPQTDGQGRGGVEVILGPGRRVAVPPGFDPETLRRVVAVLEGRPC